MVNVNKLKGKIVENGLNVEAVSARTGIDKSTFYRKLSAGGGSFTVKEVEQISDVLNLSPEQINSIFFAHEVA